MSFWKRMLSADYRAAVAAEAAGNVDARRRALRARRRVTRARCACTSRAPRAPATRQAEIAALRDAMRWAGDDPELQRQAANALGRALWEARRPRASRPSAIAARSARPRTLLVARRRSQLRRRGARGIGDHRGAANAYSARRPRREDGGRRSRKDDDAHDRAREREPTRSPSYETHMRDRPPRRRARRARPRDRSSRPRRRLPAAARPARHRAAHRAAASSCGAAASR